MSEPSALALELRKWLRANLPPSLRRETGGTTLELVMTTDIDELRAWNHLLADAGYAAVGWPAEHGGRDASPADQAACAAELYRSGAPGPINLVGIPNIAPAIMAFGTPEQEDQHLRPMLRGDVLWCQGFSEPDAGSDLASLQTRAVRDGDHYVVTGQKVWTSIGHLADMCELLVRSDPDAPKRAGITCLLVDLTLPGIERRPLRTMSGDTEFAELFFDAVRVPVAARLGPEGQGWDVALSTLAYERANFGTMHMRARTRFDALIAALRTGEGHRGVTDPLVRHELAEIYTRIRILELFATRIAAAPSTGRPGAEGSAAKLTWSRLEADIADLAWRTLGDGCNNAWSDFLLRTPSFSIAGGTTEVAKNAVASQILGLPS